MRQFQQLTPASESAPSRRSAARGLLSRALHGVTSRLLAPVRASPAPAPLRACSERLEPRHLLTMLLGGESFSYTGFDFNTVDEDGEIETINVNIRVDGNSDTQVFLYGIGQSAGGFGIGDMSGLITSPDPARNGPTRGGIGGAMGSATLIPNDVLPFVNEVGGIHQYNFTDYIGSIIPSLGGPVLLATQDLIQFSEIATNSAGENFGLQLVDVQLGDLVVRQMQVAQFNTDRSDFDPNGQDDMRNPFGSGLSERTNVGDALFMGDIIESMLDAVRAVEPDFPPEDPEDPLADRDLIIELLGADFVPGDDDTMYVGANVTVTRRASNVGFQTTQVEVPFIFEVDMSTLGPGGADVTVIASDFWADPQSFDAQTVATGVTAFAMQDANTIAIFGEFTERLNEGTQQQSLIANAGLLIHDLSTTQVRQFVNRNAVLPLDLSGEPIARLEAMEYRPRSETFNPPTELERLYALTEVSDDEDTPQQLIRFGAGQFGNFTAIGGLADVGGSPAGGNLLSLSWDPTIANPFDEGTGAFVSFDVTTDQFLVVDQRPRGVVSSSLALYNITVVNGDENTRITAWVVDDNGDPITLEGTAFPVGSVFDEEADEVVLVEPPTDSGPLYLGLKIVNEDPAFVFTVDSVDPGDITEGSSPFIGKLYNGQVRPGLYTNNSSLGGFYWAGIVTGNVRIEGALGEFYAGMIATGDAGLTGAGEIDNFAVFGDAGNIVSATSIGRITEAGEAAPVDDPTTNHPYSTGVDFAIGGRLNSIRAAGAMAASVDVRGDDPPANADLSGTFYKRLPNTPMREVERQGEEGDPADALFIAGTPRIPDLDNDDFNSFEPIGTLGDGTRLINGILHDPIDGPPDDSVDYYGVGLMAGQELIVRLTHSLPIGTLKVGIFDPEGRLVATDYEDNFQAVLSVENQPVRITARTAGVYRVAVAVVEDADFNEAGGEFPNQGFFSSPQPYQLSIRNAGNVTVGGIKSTGLLYANANSVNGADFVRVLRGDLGVIESETGTIFAPGAPQNIRASTGNIRQISGSSVGWATQDPDGTGWVNARAPKGSIGGIRASGVEDDSNYGGDVFFNWTGVFDGDNLPLVTEAIGDDIQNVRAPRDVMGNFIVGRGIGSIVAGRHWGAEAPGNIEGGSGNFGGFGDHGTGAIFANVDDLGNDGFVDMLSVGGNVGLTPDNEIFGGPAIDVGTNGNFRYFDFPAGNLIVRDPLFGFAQPEPFQQLQPGETFTFTEDSGTSVNIIPIAGRDRSTTDPNDNPQATLSVLTYPVRSGGTILITANTTNGIEVATSGRGPGATVEIGNLRTSGSGRPVMRLIDPNFPGGEPQLVMGDSFFNPNDPLNQNDLFEDIFFRFNGGNVDIFSIDATTLGGTGGKITEITNNTGGEILDLTAASVGTISAERVGIAMPRGFSDIDAVQNRSSFYPFNAQHYLIGVDGSIISVEAEELGNIYAGIDLGFNITGPGGTGGQGTGPGSGGTGGGGGGGGGGDIPGGGTGGGGAGGGGGGAGGAAREDPSGANNATDGTGTDGTDTGGTDTGGTDTGGTDTGGTDTGGSGGSGGTPGGGTAAQIGGAGDAIGGVGAGGTGGVGGIGTPITGELAGIIGTVRPNRDGAFDSERFEGIAGPIVAATPASGTVDGELTFVDIGEGILGSGSGNMAFAGLYAEGFIVDVVGNHLGADIRGDIVAAEINSIRLNGGSIVQADILGLPLRSGGTVENSDFSTTREFDFHHPGSQGGYAYAEGGGEDANIVFYEFDEVAVTGGGGIIGTRFVAADILNVRVAGGFGIINSDVTVPVEGDVELVEGDGFGIRGTVVGQGRDVGTVRAVGDAELLNLNDFSGTVDFSGEGLEFDPFSNAFLAPINDVRRALGLPTDVNPRLRRITNSGVLENVRVSGARDVALVEGVVIRNNPDALNPVGNFEQSGESFGAGNAASPDFGTSIDFGRTVDRVRARSTHGLRVEGGDLNSFIAERDLFNTQVRISGRIDNVTAGRLIWEDTSLRADGPDGFFGHVEAQDIYGFVSGDVGIGTVIAHRDLDAPTNDPAEATVTEATVRALSRIDEIIVGRHIRTGAYVRATQEIGRLQVGGDIKEGAVVHATRIDDLDVDGNIFGDIVLSA